MIELTLRNMISNRSSFAKSEIVIGFLMSKRVRGWSQFLILSISWPCTQNEIRWNWQFTDCLEKLDFFQKNPNIGILYTVGNHFLSWLTIQDRYLKIRLRLAQTNYQSFVNLYRNTCRQSRHFRLEWRVPLRRGSWEEFIWAKSCRWKWPETVDQRWSAIDPWPFHAPCTVAIGGASKAEDCLSTLFGTLWLLTGGACSVLGLPCLWSLFGREIDEKEKDYARERRETRGEREQRGRERREDGSCWLGEAASPEVPSQGKMAEMARKWLGKERDEGGEGFSFSPHLIGQSGQSRPFFFFFFLNGVKYPLYPSFKG